MLQVLPAAKTHTGQRERQEAVASSMAKMMHGQVGKGRRRERWEGGRASEVQRHAVLHFRLRSPRFVSMGRQAIDKKLPPSDIRLF
jgi:hypothetical protein